MTTATATTTAAPAAPAATAAQAASSAPAAPAAPAPAPTPSAPAAAPASPAPAPAPAAPAAGPAASPASSPAAAPAPAADWRTAAVHEVYGEPKDDDTPEVVEARDKAMKLAQRYTSPGALLKAQREAQTKINDLAKGAGLPKNATPEQLAEWRTANGIPETPDKYDLGLPKGVVLSEPDQQLLDKWVAEVHGVNATPAVVQKGAAALVALRDEQAAQITARDNEDRNSLVDGLTDEWGPQEFRANQQAIGAMLEQAGADVKDAIMSARGMDGKALGNNPAVFKWLTAHARELGFVAGTVVPNGGDIGKAIADQLQEIKASMYTDDGAKNPAYWDNPKAQARYRELLGAQSRHAK